MCMFEYVSALYRYLVGYYEHITNKGFMRKTYLTQCIKMFIEKCLHVCSAPTLLHTELADLHVPSDAQMALKGPP